MPPSAMTGTPCSSATRAQSVIAVTWGTPAPVTMRVVQMLPGPMPTLTASAPRSMRARVPSAVATLPMTSLTSGKRLAQPGRGVEHTTAVGMGRVENEEVHLGPHQGRGPLQVVARGTHGGTHPQPAKLVLAGHGVLDGLLDVLDRDQPLEVAGAVDHEDLLDAVLVELGLGLLQGRPLGHGDQVFLGHQLADRLVQLFLETEVAVGEDADQVPFGIGHRHSGDLVAGHHVQSFADALVGPHGDRVDDHSGLTALHPVHFLGLGLDREVLVNDADPAFLGQGDRQPRRGDGVHGRREDGDVQVDSAADLGPEVDLVRVHLGEARKDRDVVEGQSETRRGVDHACAGSSIDLLLGG